MTRIFLPHDIFSADHITVTGDQARHLSLVLRVKPGDTFIALDGAGHKYDCKIISVHKKEIQAEIISTSPYSAESPVSITLAQGIPKGDKMDFIVQKSTELGVRKLVPLITEHSQVRHTGKVERWKKIALSASEQSGRDRVPEIAEAVSLDDFLEQQMRPSSKGHIEGIKGGDTGPHIRVIFSEHKKGQGLRQVLGGLKDINQAVLLIGPEGGLSTEEVNAAVDRGFIEVSLGPRILRTETAPLTALSIIQYELGDMG